MMYCLCETPVHQHDVAQKPLPALGATPIVPSHSAVRVTPPLLDGHYAGARDTRNALEKPFAAHSLHVEDASEVGLGHKHSPSL